MQSLHFVMLVVACVCLFSVVRPRQIVRKGESMRVVYSGAVSERSLAPMGVLEWENASAAGSVGENVVGKVERELPVVLKFLKNEEKKALGAMEVGDWRSLAGGEYRLQLGLGGVRAESMGKQGVELVEQGDVVNHFQFTVGYRKVGNDEYEVVSFSVKSEDAIRPRQLKYSVSYQEFQGGIQALVNPLWFGRANIIGLIVNFCALVGVGIAAKAPVSEETLDDAGDETIWHMIRGDIFRPPKMVSLLALFCGVGAQVCSALLTTGVWQYRSYGDVVDSLLKNLVLAALVRGITSMNLYKRAGGLEWRSIFIYVICVTPVVIGVATLIANAIYYFAGSTALLSTDHALMVLGFFGVALVLAVIGSFVGAKLPVASPPFKPNLIPRQIPKPQFYEAFFKPVAGLYTFIWLLPAINIIFQMIHGNHEVPLPQWFAFVVLANIFVTSSAASISVVYLGVQLENHRWWWNAFLAPAFSSLYYLLFALGYGFRLHLLDASAWILHILCHTLISLSLFTVCGFSGFFSSYIFLSSLYSSLTKAK